MAVGRLKRYSMEILSFSEKGQRSRNDDKVFFRKIQENSYLFLIADGMGGYENGEAAATTAIEIISKTMIEPYDDIDKVIDCAFSKAHIEINENYSEAGTTMCGMFIKENQAHIFWSGDVKLFFVDEKNVFSTQEHTLLSLLQESKTIINSKEISRLKNTVTRAIGGKTNNYLPEQTHLKLLSDFKALICSDGVHQLFTNEEIFDILKKGSGLEAITELKNRANIYSKDNYSAIVINSVKN